MAKAKTTKKEETAASAKKGYGPLRQSTSEASEPKTSSAKKSSGQPKTASAKKSSGEPKTASAKKSSGEPKTASAKKGYGESKEETYKVRGEKLLEKVKQLIQEGNVRRIIIKDKNGKSMVEFPMTVGVVGVLVAPALAAIGALAALVTECSITVERE